MDQNISVEEVLNNSFSTIYDVLKLIDSNVSDIVINNLNNNATSDEILRLKQFKEKYIDAMEETKSLQSSIIGLFSYATKDINEIKQAEINQQNTQIEFNNELVNNYDTTQNTVEEPVTYGVPVAEEVPVNAEVTMSEMVNDAEAVQTEVPVDGMEQPVEEQPIAEETPVEAEVTMPEIVNDAEAVQEEMPTEEMEQPVEEQPIAEETPVEAEVTMPEIVNNVEPVQEEAVASETNIEEVPVNAEVAMPEIVNEAESVQEEVTPEVVNADISFDGLNNPPEEQNNGIVLPSIAESVVGNTETVTEESNEVESSEEVVSQNNETISDDLTTMYKTSNDPSKVILVTSVQYEKLKLSLDSKKALLHAKGIIDDGTGFEDQLVENGLLEGSVEDKQQQVQQLIAEAQELYKEGKSAEAQEKMNQVTALNEEIKNSSQALQAVA